MELSTGGFKQSVLSHAVAHKTLIKCAERKRNTKKFAICDVWAGEKGHTMWQQKEEEKCGEEKLNKNR